jgi:hypothetical protein
MEKYQNTFRDIVLAPNGKLPAEGIELYCQTIL